MLDDLNFKEYFCMNQQQVLNDVKNNSILLTIFHRQRTLKKRNLSYPVEIYHQFRPQNILKDFPDLHIVGHDISMNNSFLA
jgi:hypothetical protein